jgi:predicted glutamine amidotransferase
MSQIIVCYQEKPSQAEIAYWASINPHGIGIMWPKGERVHYRKGLDVSGALRWLGRVPLPCVIHFRLASVGAADDPLLTHPFLVRPDDGPDPLQYHGGQAALVHNGHCPHLLQRLPTHYQLLRRSDSWALARLWALGERVLPEGSNVVVLHPHGDIQLLGNFTCHHGRAYSSWWARRRKSDENASRLSE